MTRSIPWPRILAEGVVIIASILLALAGDAWWGERQEREEEQQLLRGLQADFVTNRDALDGIINFYQDLVARLARFEGMTAETLAALPRDSILPFSSAIQGVRTFDARNGTLDAVIASGGLSTISDLRLREMLVEWNALVEDAGEEARQVRVATNWTGRRISELGGPWDGGGSGTGPLARVMQGFSRIDLPALATDTELRAGLRQKRWESGVYLAELVPMADHADQVLALIEEQRD